MKMGSVWERAFALGFAVAALAGCSMNQPAYPAWRNESGNINSIEMAWPDGSGMGAFVDTTGGSAATAALKYRVRIVFDTGFTTTLVQDGSDALEVGERVSIQGGRVVRRETDETDPKRNVAPF